MVSKLLISHAFKIVEELLWKMFRSNVTVDVADCRAMDAASCAPGKPGPRAPHTPDGTQGEASIRGGECHSLQNLYIKISGLTIAL